MSDDDERMERANRIRRMREGQRSGDDGDTADSESAEDADSNDNDEDSDDADTAESADTVDETHDSDEDDTVESPAPDDTETTAAERTVDDQESVPTDDADPQQADAAEQQPRADGSEQPQEDSMNESSSTNETEVSSETDDAPDPQAIAQRAAQAASEVAGSGSEAVTDAVESSASEPSGDDAPAGATTAAMQGATGVELPDQEEIDAAIEAAGGSVETADATDTHDDPTERGPGTVNAAASTSEDTTRVLEFTLGDEHYCIDISLVEEIVKRDSITRVPNTDEYIVGVVDLRGQITTILDPKELMDIDAEGSETLMIVFDPDAFDDQGAIGWIVDEVRQVAPITESEVNQPPVDEDYIRGVVDRDDSEEFVIWTKPEVAITLATIDEAED